VSLIVIEADELRGIIRTEVRAALAELATTAAVPEWLNAKEAAALLGVHARTVAKLADAEELPHSRVGRLLRFRRADLVAFLERRAPR